MTTYSQVFSVKSNARRAARKAKLDPDTVTACAGGFHFPVAFSTPKKFTNTDYIKKFTKAAPPKPEPKTKAAGKTKAPKAAKPSGTKRTGKSGALLETVHNMITAKGGATMPEIIKATGWLAHTARARISGIVAKHGLKIERQRLLGVTTYTATKA